MRLKRVEQIYVSVTAGYSHGILSSLAATERNTSLDVKLGPRASEASASDCSGKH